MEGYVFPLLSDCAPQFSDVYVASTDSAQHIPGPGQQIRTNLVANRSLDHHLSLSLIAATHLSLSILKNSSTLLPLRKSMASGNPKSEPSWPELLGSGHWDGLLDPLSLPLRHLILRCGDFIQVTYDAFDNDQHSKYCGSSRYGQSTLLDRTLFPFSSDYHVASFLYATSSIDLPAAFLLYSLSREAWSKESNWIGYVAVSTDSASLASGRREIVVAWRGTIRDLEWVDVLEPELVSIDPLLSTTTTTSSDDQKPKVMKGWYTIYTSADPKSPFTKNSARDQLLATIKNLVERYKNESLSIVCVGHSLGASLAILSAFDLVENGYSSGEFPVCAVVFGSPQVGNKAFNERLETLPKLRVLHVKQKIDLIPLYPTGLLGFVYTGVELTVDGRKSPFLKDSKNPSDWHNLQAILHAVAGWNGEDGEFELRVKRSVALVNKSSEYLKDECLVPGSWWVEKNRGMVLRADGEWELAPPDEDDIPVPPSLEGGGSGGAAEVAKVDGDLSGANGMPVLPSTKKKSTSRFANFGCFRSVD